MLGTGPGSSALNCPGLEILQTSPQFGKYWASHKKLHSSLDGQQINIDKILNKSLSFDII